MDWTKITKLNSVSGIEEDYESIQGWTRMLAINIYDSVVKDEHYPATHSEFTTVPGSRGLTIMAYLLEMEKA
jgi:hypothetical protein